MRKLQERLAETEAQMTKILAAMQMVQSRVGEATTEQTKKAEQAKQSSEQTKEDNSSNNQGTENKKDKGEKVKKKIGLKMKFSNACCCKTIEVVFRSLQRLSCLFCIQLFFPNHNRLVWHLLAVLLFCFKLIECCRGVIELY